MVAFLWRRTMSKYSVWLTFLAILAFLLLPVLPAGCTGTSSEVRASLGQESSLSIGQSAVIEEEGLTLKFTEVVGDSRCPKDVVCFWQGEVSCGIEIAYSGSQYRMVLTQPGLTSEPSTKTFQQYRLTFSVDPYPESGKKIRPGDYRLRLTVDKPSVVYSLPELKYRLWAHFGDVFWCDPDLYPVARPEQEERNAIEQFPAIRADSAEFTAILNYLGLSIKTDYTDEEKLLIYRQHKKLTYSLEISSSGDNYSFTLRVGEGEGWRYEGTVTPSGKITVQSRETSFNTCPICLARGTLIATPGGPVPVEQLRPGMSVWTVDGTGERAVALVVKTASTPVPSSFQILRLTLSDSRTVAASPGHPTAEGRALGEYQVGDTLDGATVIAIEHVAYYGEATYDLLPSGNTGLYRANGILMKSTLRLP